MLCVGVGARLFFEPLGVARVTEGDITSFLRALFTTRDAFTPPEKFLFKILFTRGLTAFTTALRFTMGSRAFMRHVLRSPLSAFWPFKGFRINII